MLTIKNRDTNQSLTRISFEVLNFCLDLGNKCTYILDEFKNKFFLSCSAIIKVDIYLTFNFFMYLRNIGEQYAIC